MTEYNPGPEFRKSSGYGNRPHPRKPGETEFHTGIDFKAPIGTPIPAASDGKVVYSQFNSSGGFGYTVVIKSEGADGKPYFTQYSHMVGPGAAFGTEVRAGQAIGQVGNTGLSTGPHLHFEVLGGNAPVNNRNDPKDNGIGFTTWKKEDRLYRHDPTEFIRFRRFANRRQAESSLEIRSE
jgi:murein DD-endopeptidase MepM/ murein hydrolase activator NlpD